MSNSISSLVQRSAHQLGDVWHGVALALLVAGASTFLSEHYGAPTMLFALLIGIALHFLSSVPSCSKGIDFSAKTLLRLGVGLLGIQLGFSDVQAIGFQAVGATLAMVVLTLGCGALLSFAIGRRLAFGLLSGGAVAICGASAALALSAVLPARDDRERDTILVVITVTVLSTIAMVIYPILFQYMNFTETQIGLLIGATIHDVAQVVGAGYSINDDVGLIATMVKMLRVASLPFVVIAVHFLFSDSQSGRAHVPWFLILFVVLALLRSFVDVPEIIILTLTEASRWMLVTAIAAIGMRTDLAAIFKVHPSYLIILVLETVFLLVIAIGYIKLF